MHRFFVGEQALQGVVPGANLFLPDNVAHQVRDVLRIVVGEQIILFDNSGDELVAEVVSRARAGVEVQIAERRSGEKEPSVRIILCQGLLKTARFEWVLEKGTELGVTTFVPILCRRSMAGLEEAGPSKIQRWQRIIQEASEQCRRSHIPELQSIQPLMYALDTIPPGALALMPWEEESQQTLSSILQTARANFVLAAAKTVTVVVFIGPEGGLMPEEVALAQKHNVKVVTLGRHILRAETAAIATVANIMYALA